jgi:hypothetical protein
LAASQISLPLVFDLVGTFFEEPSRRTICFQLTDAVAIGPSLYWLEVGMPFVIAVPEMMTAAAADLAAIGSNVSAAHMVAAARTTSVVPAAADEVSAAIASVFANHAQAFQGLAGKAAAFHDQFVQTLNSGGAAYAQTEATSAAGLSSLLSLLPPELIAVGIVAFLVALYLLLALDALANGRILTPSDFISGLAALFTLPINGAFFPGPF